jgi:hypothetical protein
MPGFLIGAEDQGSAQLRSNDFFKIHIKHIPTGKKLMFEGFVTQFSDTYTAQWNEEQVYGRMDPLATYQGTKRTITLGFDIPTDSKQMMAWNMAMIQQLIQFMYPVYDSGDLSTQNVLTAAPLLTLKWTNLISSVNNAGEELVGYINGPISYAPDVAEGGFISPAITQHALEEGQLHAGSEAKAEVKEIRNYFPKKISMNFNFTVLHTHLLGWSPTGETEEDDWGGMSAAGIAAAKEGGHGAPNTIKTTTYSFGGNFDVASRFPNIYHSPPPPAPKAEMSEEREQELQGQYSLAERTLSAADSLSDHDNLRANNMDVDRLLQEQERQRLGADASAYVDEILSDRGGREGGVETYVDPETGLTAVRFAGGDG